MIEGIFSPREVIIDVMYLKKIVFKMRIHFCENKLFLFKNDEEKICF
jgi:hypothetical protein